MTEHSRCSGSRRAVPSPPSWQARSCANTCHDPFALGGDNTESEEAREYVCSEDESSQTEGLVEGLVEARMVVHEGVKSDPSVDSESEVYREMQMLEAIADRGLAMPCSLEMGSSNQASPSGSVSVAVASASEGVDIRVGVPLARRNTLMELKLTELRRDYWVPPYVVLRLPTAADVVRYPPEGSVMIFTVMYQHGLRLPLHPWVQMMLAKLGYAPRQYNPNLWLLLHGVYIAWWLVGLKEPTFEQFMYLYSISKQHGTFAGYKLIAKRQKREVILLVISLPRRSLGGTGGVWPLVIGSVRQGKPSPDTFLPTSSL
ncbi:unnamed protein product [Prunus brigantina]